MTTPDFTISKLSILDGPPNARGARLLAAFNVSIAGLGIEGCVLVENAMGITKAHGPIGKTSHGHKASVFISDPVLQRAIARRAATAYSGLTGRALCDE